MISRSRSAPTAAAMSIECTTSANSTVTCLYSADRVACVSGAPHSLQNLEFGLAARVPHDPQNSPVAVSPPPPSPLGSTSVSFHRWSAMSVISPCHLRHEVLRPSYVVCFETAVSSGGRNEAPPTNVQWGVPLPSPLGRGRRAYSEQEKTHRSRIKLDCGCVRDALTHHQHRRQTRRLARSPRHRVEHQRRLGGPGEGEHVVQHAGSARRTNRRRCGRCPSCPR